MKLYNVFVCWLIVLCIHNGLSQDTVAKEIMKALPAAITTAMRMLSDTLKQEAKFAHDNLLRRRAARSGGKTQSFRFVQGFLGSTPQAKHLSFPSFVQIKTFSIIRTQFKLNNGQAKELMDSLPSLLRPNSNLHVPDTPFPHPRPDTCPFPARVACDPRAPYRTYDGSCNNMQRPLWGSSHQPLSRLLAPQYADGIEAPRISVTGSALPSARLVSTTVHWDVSTPHHFHTNMLTMYGQFTDHDLTRTAISKLTMDPSGFGDDLEDVECGSDGCQTAGLENQACLPIVVPRNDTDFARTRPCLMFVRSQEVPNAECRPGPREQLNQLTSFLDASNVYGSTQRESTELREESRPDRGMLKLEGHPFDPLSKGMLPFDREFNDCRGDNRTILCFKAGDGRVNENMGLTTIHLMFTREHNRLEAELHRLNPHWGGERLYQEARRLLTAIWQYTVYNEWLPVILGPRLMDKFGVRLPQTGFRNGYDPAANPSVTNSFATAAMRFGHSLVQGTMSLSDNNYQPQDTLQLSTIMRRPQIMYRRAAGGSDSLLRGMMADPAQTSDPFVTRELTSRLFAEDPPNGLGEDLMALNIQRGREHGLPGYNAYRQFCGLPRARTFEDLSTELPPQVIDRFRRLYRSVDDIDLWPAGISEHKYPGSILGPTFACIIGTQYRNLRAGDRFWFENNQQNPYPFNQAQLTQIRRSSIAKILCENSETIRSIQPWVLLQPLRIVTANLRRQNRAGVLGDIGELYRGGQNERTSCSSIPSIDLRPWQEPASQPPPSARRPVVQRPTQQPSPSIRRQRPAVGTRPPRPPPPPQSHRQFPPRPPSRPVSVSIRPRPPRHLRPPVPAPPQSNRRFPIAQPRLVLQTPVRRRPVAASPPHRFPQGPSPRPIRRQVPLTFQGWRPWYKKPDI